MSHVTDTRHIPQTRHIRQTREMENEASEEVIDLFIPYRSIYYILLLYGTDTNMNLVFQQMQIEQSNRGTAVFWGSGFISSQSMR